MGTTEDDSGDVHVTYVAADRGTEITAFLLAVLMGAAIIGLFMFLTWLTYATA